MKYPLREKVFKASEEVETALRDADRPSGMWLAWMLAQMVAAAILDVADAIRSHD